MNPCCVFSFLQDFSSENKTQHPLMTQIMTECIPHGDIKFLTCTRPPCLLHSPFDFVPVLPSSDDSNFCTESNRSHKHTLFFSPLPLSTNIQGSPQCLTWKYGIKNVIKYEMTDKKRRCAEKLFFFLRLCRNRISFLKTSWRKNLFDFISGADMREKPHSAFIFCHRRQICVMIALHKYQKQKPDSSWISSAADRLIIVFLPDARLFWNRYFNTAKPFHKSQEACHILWLNK